jgi:hypothetical protein
LTGFSLPGCCSYTLAGKARECEVDWKIPDWASVIGLIWAVGTTVWAVTQHFRHKQSEALTHRFLVGLKAGVPPAAQKQIDDELDRIKPSNKVKNA